MKIILEPEDGDKGERLQLDGVVQFSLVGKNVVNGDIVHNMIGNKGQLIGLLRWAEYEIEHHGSDDTK